MRVLCVFVAKAQCSCTCMPHGCHLQMHATWPGIHVAWWWTYRRWQVPCDGPGKAGADVHGEEAYQLRAAKQAHFDCASDDHGQVANRAHPLAQNRLNAQRVIRLGNERAQETKLKVKALAIEAVSVSVAVATAAKVVVIVTTAIVATAASIVVVLAIIATGTTVVQLWPLDHRRGHHKLQRLALHGGT